MTFITPRRDDLVALGEAKFIPIEGRVEAHVGDLLMVNSERAWLEPPARCTCWKPTAPGHQLDCPAGRMEPRFTDMPFMINRVLRRDPLTGMITSEALP